MLVAIARGLVSQIETNLPKAKKMTFAEGKKKGLLALNRQRDP
jgi:hypothetical protein